MTFAERFIQKALALMPHQTELQEIDPSINDRGAIDEIMFAKGEYLGGMAAVILALIDREDISDPPSCVEN